jgi:RHS repeat-associated protein
MLQQFVPDPLPYRDPVFSLRRPSRSILSRFLAHLLVRLLIIAPFPSNLQAAAALFPVSMLWPLVAPHEPAKATSSACILQNRVRGFDQENAPLVGSEGPQFAESHHGSGLAYDGIASDRLYYAKARYYEPTIGRFISQDTFLGNIDDPPRLHRYFYANANPTRYIDPTGHIAALRWLENKIEGVKKKILNAGVGVAEFVNEKNKALGMLGVGTQISKCTGTAAGIVGFAAETVGVVNLVVNIVAWDKAKGTRFWLEANEELTETAASIERTAKMATENPSGVALQLATRTGSKALNYLLNEPRAVAEVESVKTEVGLNIAAGVAMEKIIAGGVSKGTRAAETAVDEVANVADDMAKGVARTGSEGIGSGPVLRNPAELRFSQDSIRAGFRDPKFGSIDDLAEGLRTGRITPAEIKPIRLVKREGKLVTIDNRRLEAFRRAGVEIPTRMATPEEIAQAIRQGKFSAGELGAETIKVRGR